MTITRYTLTTDHRGRPVIVDWLTETRTTHPFATAEQMERRVAELNRAVETKETSK